MNYFLYCVESSDVIVLFMSSFYISFFLTVSIFSVKITHLVLNVVHHFKITFSILITIVWNSFSDTSNICVIFESGHNDLFYSWECFVFLPIFCFLFFLKKPALFYTTVMIEITLFKCLKIGVHPLLLDLYYGYLS